VNGWLIGTLLTDGIRHGKVIDGRDPFRTDDVGPVYYARVRVVWDGMPRSRARWYNAHQLTRSPHDFGPRALANVERMTP
jgi:hypothetical protein